ncbi:hypothetical protein GAYE_PCTG69G1418 [Galdieria yellowstonensis]|jgi:pyruvate/oxaloacetate carboxyltransferase|uniref:Uncharacterized protein n=1 Tax=Galdieria yellowstonensis TaxID=3028027 RepID=A0AAV9I847_9RHOD|nr:hypothetical protein GAYE_PCTG69G1418 [Galdieria yellowstonensis]
MKQTAGKGTAPLNIRFSRSLSNETEDKITTSSNDEDEQKVTKSDSEEVASTQPVETVLKACSAPSYSATFLPDISAVGCIFKKTHRNLVTTEKTKVQKESWQQTLDAETPPYLSPQRKELRQHFEF